MMSLRDRLAKLLGRKKVVPDNNPQAQLFELVYTPTSVDFVLPHEDFDRITRGEGNHEAQLQFVLLRVLEEQGAAEEFRNGFSVGTEDIARLGHEESDLLGLPKLFPGSFVTRAPKHTGSHDFTFRVFPTLQGRDYGPIQPLEGAFLDVAGQRYRLSLPIYLALKAVEEHATLSPAEKTPAANVGLIAKLQQAQHLHEKQNEQLRNAEPEAEALSWPLDLRQFKNFTTREPENVRVSVESNEDGSLTLTPDLGVTDDPRILDEYWPQLDASTQEGVLRVGNDLIILTPRILDSVQKIRNNATVPRDRVEQFYQAPGEHLGLEGVDIDLSFNVRVKGIAATAPVSFAEASQTGIEWIEEIDHALPAEAILDIATDEEKLVTVENAIETAREAGGTYATVDEYVIDISDTAEVDAVLDQARLQVQAFAVPPDTEKEQTVQVGVVIEDVEDIHTQLSRLVIADSDARPLDLSNFLRTPYKYQEEGIRWLAQRMILSLSGDLDSPERIHGAILADDMGLGKTFMTLAALEAFIAEQQERRGEALPTLAVLPLSLIENWEDEIAATFNNSPFDDVVVLQGNRDLNRFKLQGRSRETIARASDLDEDGFLKEDAIKVSLAIGSGYGEHRLDMPNRLVLTTYDTLASFQISLGQIEWGAVVFDEAQNIKNPLAIRTRAAKGLKSRFKLLATGTPVENEMKDFWCLMDTAQPGLLGSWAEFRKKWVVSDKASDEDKQSLGLRLADHVRPFMLRRSKEDQLQDLPPKTIYSGLSGSELERYEPWLATTMRPRQCTAYDSELARHETRSLKSHRGAALETIQALRAVSLHADAHKGGALGKASDPNDSARLISTFRVLDKVRDAGEKAIIFVINKKFQFALAGWLMQRYGLVVNIVNGDTKALSSTGETRKSIIKEFEKKEGFNVIIMSPLAVGTGLTVVGANHAIHLERDWNPAKEAQATDRIYRIGQKRPVHVYLPLAKHPERRSFDENLNALLRRKTMLKDALMVPAAVSSDELEKALEI